MESSSSLDAAPAAAELLDPVEILAAAADPARLALLREIAREGPPRHVTELAARVGRSPDLVAKHLRVLREARLVVPVVPPGTDGRRLYHQIPASFRARDAAGRAVVDYGCVLLRLG